MCSVHVVSALSLFYHLVIGNVTPSISVTLTGSLSATISWEVSSGILKIAIFDLGTMHIII